MRALLIFICCYLAVSPVIGRERAGDRASRPDVFLITIDTLRADHLHCYGYDQIQTPALDQLTKQGIRFTQAFTPSPITNTSHTSILTGLLPSSHGVSDFGIPLAASHPTLAELLENRGYQTAAFIGAVILDSKTLAPGLDRGFNFYDNFPEHSEAKSHWGRIERRGMDVVQRTEAWLTAHPTGSHFVWVHLYDPHDPYEPPPPYSEIYKDRLYDGEIAYADSALGHFLAHLKKQNRFDGALIIVVGDHGEGLGEHHEDTHGIFLYDSTTHVPLIVKLPNGRATGREVVEQVRTMDIMPTILDLLDIPLPTELDGASLRPLLLGTGGLPLTVIGETDYPLRFGWAPLRSIRQEGSKFVEAPRPEFYDLHSDAGELHNHYAPWDATVQKLRKTLAESNAKSRVIKKNSPTAVSPSTIDELHALGYLGAADAGSSTNVPEPSLLPDPKDKIEEQNLLHTAMLASEDGHTDKARAALEKLLQIDEMSFVGLSHLGHVELISGNYSKAASYLQRARELRPDDAIAAFDFGQALEHGGDLSGARDALNASLKLDPNQYAARLLLGHVYFLMNDPTAAQDQLEAAAILKPQSVEVWVEIGKVLIAQKKFAEAVEQLEQTVETDDNNPELFEVLAQAYTGLGKPQEAQRARNRAARAKARSAQKSKRPQ
ncbi:MAG TPA: sulfatase-like hydrolase/transferase [Candidatus Acidoferrum sp.]|nr:sulfatase-like hydrolase/transferase [Candidatus Acidoferrum sp.]